MSEQREAFEKVLDTLNRRFTSGNDVPVSRNAVTREEYQVIREALERTIRELERNERQTKWWHEVQSLGVDPTKDGD